MTGQEAGQPIESLSEQTASLLGSNLRNLCRHIGAVHNQSPEAHLISTIPIRNGVEDAFKKLYPEHTPTPVQNITISSTLSFNHYGEESYDILFMHAENSVMFYFWYNPNSPGNSRGYYKAFSELGNKAQGWVEERRMTDVRASAINEFIEALSPNLEVLTPSPF